MWRLVRTGLMSLAALGWSSATVLATADAPPAAEQHQDDEAGGGTNMTGQPNTTPLPGSDVPTPFDADKNRSPAQRKAGDLFDNVPVDPGPAAPSPETPANEPEDHTVHTAPPKTINPEKPQPPR